MSVLEVDILLPRYGNRVTFVPPLGPESISSSGLNLDDITARELVCPWINTDVGNITIEPDSGTLRIDGDLRATGDVYCDDIFMTGSSVTAPGSIFFDLGPAGKVEFDGDLVGHNLILTATSPTATSAAAEGLSLNSFDGTVTIIKSPAVSGVIEVTSSGDMEIRSPGNLVFDGNVLCPIAESALIGPTMTLTGPTPKIVTQQSGVIFEGWAMLTKASDLYCTMDVSPDGDLTMDTTDMINGKLMFNGNQVFPYDSTFAHEGPELLLTGPTPTVVSTGGGMLISCFGGTCTLVKASGESTTTLTTDSGTITLNSFSDGVHFANGVQCGIINHDMLETLVLNTSGTDIRCYADTGHSVNINSLAQKLVLAGAGMYLDSAAYWGTAGIHPQNTFGNYLNGGGNLRFETSSPIDTEWSVKSSGGPSLFGVCNEVSPGYNKYVSVYSTQQTANTSTGAFRCAGGMSCLKDLRVGTSLYVNGPATLKNPNVATRSATMVVDATGNLLLNNNSTDGTGHVRVRPRAGSMTTVVTSNAVVSGMMDFPTAATGIMFGSSGQVWDTYYTQLKLIGVLFGAFQDAIMDFSFSRIANIVFVSWKNVEVTPGVSTFAHLDMNHIPDYMKPNVMRRLSCNIYDGGISTWGGGTMFFYPNGSIEVGPAWDYTPTLSSGELEGHSAQWTSGWGGYGISAGSGFYAVDYQSQ